MAAARDDGVPEGAVTIRNYTKARKAGRFMLSVVLLVGFVWTLRFVVLWESFNFELPPPFALSLTALAMVPVLGFAYWGIARAAYWQDIEYAPGFVRLPFRGKRGRAGWREISEIAFFGRNPHPAAVGAARRAFHRCRMGFLARLAGKLALREWAGWGGLLVVTRDEVLWIRESDAVINFLVEYVENDPAFDPARTGGADAAA